MLCLLSRQGQHQHYQDYPEIHQSTGMLSQIHWLTMQSALMIHGIQLRQAVQFTT
jgi:hypothetical protein